MYFWSAITVFEDRKLSRIHGRIIRSRWSAIGWTVTARVRGGLFFLKKIIYMSRL